MGHATELALCAPFFSPRGRPSTIMILHGEAWRQIVNPVTPAIHSSGTALTARATCLTPLPSEPPHIHIEQGDSVAKFWLGRVSVAESRGFRSHQLNQLRALLIEHRAIFLEAWNAHFGR